MASSPIAQQFTSPEDLLGALYEVTLFGRRPVTDFEPFFSDELTAALAKGRLGPEQFKKLGFNPITGLTDANLVTVLNLQTVEKAGSRARSIASFNADDVPVSISFELVFEEKHGWQIDSMQGTAGSMQWNIADLVAAVKDQ